LRHYLQTHAKLDCVVDYGDLQVFEGVTTYPAIVTLEKGPPQPDHTLRFLVLKKMPETDIAAAIAADGIKMPQARLSDAGWELEGGELAAIRQKIRHGKKTLKDVYGSPLYGIKTGCNDAFVIDRETRDKLIAQDPKAAGLLKPFVEGKDLKPWHVESRDIYLIYIPKHTISIDDYPSIKTHLLPHRDTLEKRATKQEWFELQQAQLAYVPSFEGPKIIYGHFSPEPLFSHDSRAYYSNDKSYVIPNGDYFLLGLLNSRPLWFITTSLCPPVQGGYHEVRVQYIETLPIPDASDEQKAAIAAIAQQSQQTAENLYRIQDSVRHRIKDLSPTPDTAKLNKKLLSWWRLTFPEFRKEIQTSFKVDILVKERGEWETYLAEPRAKIEQLTRHLASLEADLNAKVSKLFRLSPDEIKLLECE
jgi:hypothetical protein